MYPASQAYKATMKKKWRNERNFVRVTIGVVNQEAQASAYVSNPEGCTYYSSLKKPFDNYPADELYVACDQDYTTVDGSMYFLPRNRWDAVLNQGIVTEGLRGVVEIRFSAPYDLKGLTVEFGKAHPVDFVIESDNHTVHVAGNADGHYVTEDIFPATTFLRFVPATMVNGEGRLRIHQITMGIGIYFSNREIKSANKKEFVSPITEELPTIDFDMTIDNKGRAYDIENEESTINFLEIGQEIAVVYGQELENGTIEWMPGAVVRLKEWSADDEVMSFSATDRIADLDGMYYRGEYRASGASLYDLAVDVLADAGVDPRTYWLDEYLKTVIINNPVPAVTHKEALQLIANAGRCVLSQDRNGDLYMKSSFVPDMEARSDNETYYSSVETVLNGKPKAAYASAARDFTDAVPTQYFMPRNAAGATFLDVGYLSEAVAGENGHFSVNPSIEIGLEAAYKCFGLTIEFGRNHPAEMLFHASLNGTLVESYAVADLEEVTVVSHEFPEFDRLVLEFTKGAPFNRVVVNNITFGDSTDYVLEYGNELTKTPRGTQQTKVKELQVVRTIYAPGGEVKELARQQVSGSGERLTFYFSYPAYDLTCNVGPIVARSSYFATVEVPAGGMEVTVSGREYLMSQAKFSRQLNVTGTLETWENPLVSSAKHADDLAGWVGDYLRADREYDLQYRGEPRIDANDIMFLENKYVPDLLLRAYQHTLKFDGALSGTIKARRNMGNVAAAKNRLAKRG